MDKKQWIPGALAKLKTVGKTLGHIMYLARKEHRNAQIRLRKINDSENPRHGGHIEVGFDKVFTVDSSYFRVPAVGERFNIGDLSTSGVQEIIDDKTFKTYNSIYEWTVLEKTPE